jgi:hypothetical protein
MPLLPPLVLEVESGPQVPTFRNSTYLNPQVGLTRDLGACQELKRNILEQRKKEKNPSPTPPTTPTQNLKEKKSRHFECMLSLPIGCIKFLFPKLFITIFGMG